MAVIFIFSHSPQLLWYSIFAEAFKEYFVHCKTVLFVHGESDKKLASKFQSYDEIIDLTEGFLFKKNPDHYNIKFSKELLDLEAQLDNSFIWQDTIIDRWIRAKNNKSFTIQYLNFSFAILNNYYKKYKPLCGLGESNYAIYRLAHRLFEKDKKIYMLPIMTRYFKRFYLETDWNFQRNKMRACYSNYLQNGIPKHLHKIALSYFIKITQNNLNPCGFNYATKNKGYNEFKWRNIGQYFYSLKQIYYINKIEAENNIRLVLSDKNIFSKLSRYVNNKKRLKFFKKLAVNTIPDNIKACSYFLHYEPEYTIDGIGRFYRNQIDLINNIAASLPADYILLVKEHIPMLGLRDKSFYVNILKNNNVILIDATFNSRNLIKKSDLIFTVVGTSAIEAMMIGKPSIIFAKCAHSDISLISFCNDYWQLQDLIKFKLNSSITDTKIESLAFLAAEYKTSSPGIMPSSPDTINTIMNDDENKIVLKNSFKKELALLIKNNILEDKCKNLFMN